MENTNIRANRVAVKADGENFTADFYRTHKAVGSVNSEDTNWVAPDDATNKTTARESFRQYVIANAVEFGIDWKPEDMRAPQNIRKAKYDSDDALISEAMEIIIPEMKELTEKCKYNIGWGGINHDEIIPLTHTGSGRDLSTMGIEDGKYSKSGNWAWAELKFTSVFTYNGEECYIPVTMQLVSGQLKKAGIGITEFTSKVKDEIIGAGLATVEQLEPTKETKKSEKKDEDKSAESVKKEDVKEKSKAKSKVENVKEEVKPTEAESSEKKPKRSRKSKATETAEA